MSCLMCSSSWKGGKSIDNLTRKEIWEENFRTRESLKGVQQSQHFWDFQTSNGCPCETPHQKPLPRSRSLQNIDKQSQIPRTISTPSVAQALARQHDNMGCRGRCQRDVGTVTTPPRVDKSVGPGPRRVELAPSRQGINRPFIVGTASNQRDRTSDWSRNEATCSRQQRQDSLQRLRKGEEALQQALQRKRNVGNICHYSTEYSRSYKDAGVGGWARTAPRRAGTPIPRQGAFPFPAACHTPMLSRPAVS